jgi:hypothetical protein
VLTVSTTRRSPGFSSWLLVAGGALDRFAFFCWRLCEPFVDTPLERRDMPRFLK